MEKLKLNSTPVRTANNFGINDISLDIDIPKIREFHNVSIMSYEMDDIQISEMNIDVSENKMSSKIGLELNTNYALTITVPEDVKINAPVMIMCDFDEDNNVLVDNIKIIMEKNSKADFILKYEGNNCFCRNNCDGCDKVLDSSQIQNNARHIFKMSNEGSFHYLKQETELKENSEISIVIANMISKDADSFIAVENTVGKNAKLDHIIVDFGGKNKISNYYSRVNGDFAQNDLKTIYLGTNQDVIDINYNIEVYGKNVKCNIDTQGALNGASRKNFKGTIDFKEGCKRAKGCENENCMILSENAKSKSLPMLLCHEEDVEGEHGVSSGKIDEAKLFYIMTKGISYDDAKKLIVKANFSSIIKDIKDEDLQDEILRYVSI